MILPYYLIAIGQILKLKVIIMEIEAGSVLANRGLNMGYGYGNGGYGNGHGNFPGDGSAVKEAVRGNRDLSLLESVNRTAADQAISDRITDGHSTLKDSIITGNQFLTDRVNAQGIDAKFANVTAELASQERVMIAGFASAERTANTNQLATMAQLHAMDIKQTECCCELKAGQAAISAKLDADRAAAAESEVNNLRLQIQINNQSRGNSGN